MRNCEKDMHLVPFGKYKGQPVEVMQMDTGYCDWLSKQDWFREQYGNVYNQVIINNFTEPSETPEHNRLQMRFLDENFVESFVSKKLRPAIYAKYFNIENIQFEHYGWDVCIEYSYSKYSDDEADRYNSVCFEIKPCLGDDFPAVLRQMKKNSNLVDSIALAYDHFANDKEYTLKIKALKQFLSKKSLELCVCKELLVNKQLVNDFFYKKYYKQIPILQSSWYKDALGEIPEF